MIRHLGLIVVLLLSLLRLAEAEEPDVHYELGMKAFHKGDYLKASEELALSLEIQPDVQVALYLGNAYLRLGQLGKAKGALERVLQIDPATPRRDAIVKLVTSIESRNVGVVQITSSPPGATVYVNEKSASGRGKTPFDLSLPPGTHKLIFELEGYVMGSAEVTIKFGETTSLDLPLQALVCELTISSTPAGGRASIDAGEPTALPGTARVTKGDHVILVSADGFRTQKHSVHCDGASPLSVAASLIALPADFASTLDRKAGLSSSQTPSNVECPPPPPPLRIPTWRLATGVIGIAAGGLLIGFGAPAIALDGLCSERPVMPGVVCTTQFESLSTGLAVTSLGGISAVVGTVLLTLPPKPTFGRKR